MTAFTLNETTGDYHTTSPVTGSEIILQAKEILQTMLARPRTEVFTDPGTARDFLRLTLANREREVFACLFLDNRHRLISYDELFLGTIGVITESGV
ncbi:MAG: JAB domain-containing protein [Candidatus Sedimenticola sp. (ex Thyasira tokunagai)]